MVAKWERKLTWKNSGLPKGGNSYGNGSLIVGRVANRGYHTEVEKPILSPKPEAHVGQRSLGELLSFDKQGRCNNALNVLSNPIVLESAYLKIKSNPGNMTRGNDSQTLDGISRTWIHAASGNLYKEKFNFSPTRRVYIPKANGKMRPLGIGSPREKIIQEAYRAILEAVLEKHFHNSSHGFRPSRSCHTALAQIRYWNGIKWFIEGDIKGFFDNIDHHKLEELLKRYFNDQRFIDLYWKLVRAGYVEFDTTKPSATGVPQGGIVSPILSNLYLHELDVYVSKLQTELEKKNKGARHTIKNPAYKKIDFRIQGIGKVEKKRKLKGLTLDDERRLERQALIKLRRQIPSTLPNPGLAKIYYVRYADDWIIGVAGSKETANLIKEKIKNFLKSHLNLELSEEKTLITNAGKSKAKFLGVEISRTSSVKGEIKSFRNSLGHKQRIPTTATILNAPIKKLLEKLVERKIMVWGKTKRNGIGIVPQPILSLTVLPVPDIIIRYKMILNGIFNYYSFVNNRPRLVVVYWILKKSLAKTLATKLRLETTRKVLLKFGRNIVYKYPESSKTIDFSLQSIKVEPKNFKMDLNFNDPLKNLDWKLRTINSFDMVCSNCGTDEKIQMHHVKHIRGINAKLSPFEKQMAAINRKQVPLCKACHNLVHTGKYDGGIS